MYIVKKINYPLAGAIYTVFHKDRDGLYPLNMFTTWHETKDYLVEAKINSYRWEEDDWSN